MSALLVLRTYWREAVIAALLAIIALCVVAIERGKASFTAERAAHAATVASYRTAAEKARADDFAHARAVEQRYATIAQETQNDLTARLAAARADADRYAARLRAATAADSGSRGGTGVSVAATAAGGAVGAGPSPELDDARACAEAVTKAEGWLGWWMAVATPAP